MIPISEYKNRREVLLSQVLDDSIVIVPAATEKVRSRDTEYAFRQDSDFYYLTGFCEPEAILILSRSSDRENTQSILFVREKDEFAEIWHGKRLGCQAAPEELGVDIAFGLSELGERLPELLHRHQQLYYSLGCSSYGDKIVQGALEACRRAPKQSLVAPPSIHDVNKIIHEMRLIKSECEIEVMSKSAQISAEAHCLAMRNCHAGMFEYQLEAIILHHFAMNGARNAAYNSIVGAGDNACILHYTENSTELKQGDLVLIDAGSEFYGYAADITRTFPVSGRFNDAQKAIYQLVLDAQKEALATLCPGVSIADAMSSAVKVITTGLISLGILQGDLKTCIEREDYKAFFMHGLGHYLGLDVHDVGDYKENGHDKLLQKGMIITVEPGLYIPKHANVPDIYKGIGVRIEDDVLITENGYKVLTGGVPKEIVEIEALMQA